MIRVNCGSIGQPRHKLFHYNCVSLESDMDVLWCRIEYYAYWWFHPNKINLYKLFSSLHHWHNSSLLHTRVLPRTAGLDNTVWNFFSMQYNCKTKNKWFNILCATLYYCKTEWQVSVWQSILQNFTLMITKNVALLVYGCIKKMTLVNCDCTVL
jgi:hypothetical protein